MDDIHRMLALVKDPNPQIRKYALTQVEELTDGVDDEDVLEVLRDAARDSVPLVSHQAIRSLARLLGKAFLAGPEAGRELGAEAFEGVQLAELRTAGLEILRPAIEILHGIVRGEDKRAARRALISLGKIAGPGSTEVVAACLQDPALAGAAAIALPGIGGEEALRPLLAAGRDLDSPGRLHAVLELGHFREESSRELLLELARDTNAAIRANAAMALGEQRADSMTREILGALLSDPEVWVTVYAIRGLSRDACVESAQLVASTYHKVEDPHVQASCLAVLGSMGPIALGPAEAVVQSGLGHPDDRVRANAVEAAGRLVEDKAHLLNLIAPLSTDPNNRVLANVAVGISQHDVPAAVEILQRLAQSGDRWFQTSAAWAAGAVAKPEAFTILTQLATSHEAAILMMIVRALDSFPAPESLPLLTRLAVNEDPMVRTRAAESLGRIGGDQICQFLANRFIQEQDEVARGALVNALAATRASGVTTVLMQALADSHPRVQANAVEALGRVGSLDVLSAVRPFASGEKSRLQANAWIALWRLGEMEMAAEAARSLNAVNQEGLASAIYAVGEMGRELRRLGQQRSNLLLLSALRDRAQDGLGGGLAEVPPQARFPSTPSPGVSRDGFFQVEEVIEAMLSGDFSGAEQRARALPPSVPAGIGPFLLSRLKLAQKDQQGGLQLLEEACSQKVRCLPAHLDLANYYLRSRRDREAAERFLCAFRIRREVLGQLSDVAQGALEQGHLTAVSRLLKFLFSQGPVSPDTNGRVGREYLAVGDFEKAFEFLFLGRIEFPRDLGLVVDYGVSAFRVGKPQLARKVAEIARRASASGDEPSLNRLKLLEQTLDQGGRA